MKEQYTWGGKPCVRVGEYMDEEAHPCYYCGSPILTKEAKVCSKCHFEFCPNCGICFCNGTKEKQAGLRTLRNLYCCNRVEFEKGISSEDREYLKESLRVVPHFKKALDNCRRIKGCKGNYDH